MTAPTTAQRIREEIAGFFPGYFSLVMATGIVSVASQLMGYPPLAWGLFWLNLGAYAVLWGITLARVTLYGGRVWADLTDHSRGPGFFTLVAATCILGNQLVIVAGAPEIARWLWVLAVVLWLPILYIFFAAVTVRAEKPPLERGLNGAWQLTIVAMQSLAVLGVLTAAQWGQGRELLLFAALCLYLVGCMFYLLIVSLIFYRFTFFPFAPATLAPPYWINMGAVAITTLAGTTLILNADGLPLLGELLPFLKGFTLFYWSTATWWIPLLVILGVWRHNVRRFPLVYDPQYWAMVFPLGMYATCTLRLAQAIDLPGLGVIARGFLLLALVAWAATAVGLLLELGKWMAAPRTEAARR